MGITSEVLYQLSYSGEHPILGRPAEDVAERLAERALKEHVSPEELASEAVRSYVGAVVSSTKHRALGFVGLGHSGRSDISERAEEILRADFGA